MKNLILSVLTIASFALGSTAQTDNAFPVLGMTPQDVLGYLGQPTEVKQTASGYTWIYGCPVTETNDLCIILDFRGGVVATAMRAVPHAVPQP